MYPMTLDQLRTATAAGGLEEVVLKAKGGAFFVHIATAAGGDGLLVTTRSRSPRGFANLAKAMVLLRGMGIVSFTVDTADWTPGQPERRKARPDRAEAMRRTREAVEHDAWFRAEVEKGLGELADPTVKLIAHDEVAAQWRLERAEYLRRADESDR